MMNDSLEQESVVDFLLESEKHLEVAARMSQAFPLAQRKIAVPVLDGLEQQMAEVVGSGWVIHNPRDEVFRANYPRLTVWQESWAGYYLSLENQTQEGSSTVGIWRAKNPATVALDDALAEAFAAQNLSGHRNGWWAWFKTLPPELGAWGDAPALAAMHFKRAETIKRLADELIQVWKISRPVIEAYFRASTP